ncbi:MAG: 30S ribosomal protein S20 [Myxococcota bacterium]
MANHKQAIKRHKQSLKRRDRNNFFRATQRSLLRRARTALEAGDKEQATKDVEAAKAFIDRIAGKGIIHPNRADRLKSRLTRQLNAL